MLKHFNSFTVGLGLSVVAKAQTARDTLLHWHDCTQTLLLNLNVERSPTVDTRSGAGRLPASCSFFMPTIVGFLFLLPPTSFKNLSFFSPVHAAAQLPWRLLWYLHIAFPIICSLMLLLLWWYCLLWQRQGGRVLAEREKAVI